MTVEEIQAQLAQQRQLLRNYEELLNDVDDDPAYVARGNGFCDAKYSEDFLQGQLETIRSRIAALEAQLAK